MAAQGAKRKGILPALSVSQFQGIFFRLGAVTRARHGPVRTIKWTGTDLVKFRSNLLNGFDFELD